MDKNTESLIRQIHEKDVRELAEDHIRDVVFEGTKKEVIIFVDKRYAMHLLHSRRYLPHFTQALKKLFGEDIHIILRIEHPRHAHDREMLIPHAVHYDKIRKGQKNYRITETGTEAHSKKK